MEKITLKIHLFFYSKLKTIKQETKYEKFLYLYIFSRKTKASGVFLYSIYKINSFICAFVKEITRFSSQYAV